MSGAFSQRPLKGAPAYGACNGAIESLGKALAVELALLELMWFLLEQYKEKMNKTKID